MKNIVTIILILFLLQLVSVEIIYARHIPEEAIGIILGPIVTRSPQAGHISFGLSSNIVYAIFNISVESRSLFYLPNGEDDHTLTYLGVGYFQLIQIQGENYSVRLRSDITIFNDSFPGFSKLDDRWGIIRRGVVLTFIVDKSWRPSRSGWYISAGVGLCL